MILTLTLYTIMALPPNAIIREADVPPYTLPDPLLYSDGTVVRDPDTWRNHRRPELLHLFESEVYGKTLLGRPPNLKFVLREKLPNARNGKATRLRVAILFEGTETGRQMELLVYLPNNAKSPSPLFLGLNFDGNYTTTDETDIPLPAHYIQGLFTNKTVNEAKRGIHKAQWQYDLALDAGYAVATAAYGQVEPDLPDSWQIGPRALATPPGPSDWGAIGAWAWALSRAMDYLETNPQVDVNHVAVMGFSRLGKAAVWAAAQDQRFALCISFCSGAGGAALSKRLFGEDVAHLTQKFPHWFCPNFQHYANKESNLPIDQHQLIALIAPRPILILSAAEDLWSDPRGEFLGGLGADSVYRLLGTDGIAQKEWPQVGQLLTSRIGYHLRQGKHDVKIDDWNALLAYAKMQWNR